jgi:hypothetical protein
MLPILHHPDIKKLILTLNEEEIAFPDKVLDELCTEYDPGDLREQLSDIFEIALSESDIYDDPASRRQLIYLKTIVIKSLEAIFIKMDKKAAFKLPKTASK